MKMLDYEFSLPSLVALVYDFSLTTVVLYQFQIMLSASIVTVCVQSRPSFDAGGMRSVWLECMLHDYS